MINRKKGLDEDKLLGIVRSLPRMSPDELSKLGAYLLVIAVSIDQETVTEALDVLRYGYPIIEDLLRKSFGQITDYKLAIKK